MTVVKTHIEDLREMFNAFDTDRSNTISASEIQLVRILHRDGHEYFTYQRLE